MIKKKYFILLLILFLLSLSICVAADNDSISPDTQYTEYNEKDSIAENNNIFENLDNNKIYEKKENNSLIDRNGDVIQKKNISSVKTANQEKKITITEKNFNNYFIYNNGIVRLDKSILLENRDYIYLINYLPYDVNKITIDITDSNFENNSMKFVGRNNNTLTNCALTIDSNIKNITVENFNLIFNENYQLTTFVTVGTRTNLCVLNNISVNVDVEQTGSQSYVLSLNKPTIVENSNITVKCLETNIDWYGPGDKIPTIVPIVVKSSNCLMNNNRIHITSKGHRTESYYSLYGVYIGGDNFIFTNNSICVDNATGYAYGFVDRSKNNLILDNFVEVYSEAYSAGINIEGAAIHNNIVKNNRIHLVAGNDTSQAGLGNPSVAYAIEILDYVYNGGPYKNYKNSPKATNNSFINNTITGFARQFYGFEIYGGANTLIENNTINATGSVTMGIGAIGENVTINNNYIEVRGLHNQTEATVDYIVAMTAGIYNFYSSDGIKITNNTLLVEKGKGIKTSECENILIENNLIITEDYAYTLEISGSNNSIKYNGIIHENNIKDTIIVSENNTVKNNREPTNSQLTINIPETIEVNKQTSINISLKDEYDNNIPNQYITLKIGDTNEHTLITDNNGECTYEYTGTKAGTTSITAEYKCYQDYGSSITKNITIKENVIITYQPIVDVDYGANVTITGTFKEENGKSITNSNVKILINGVKYYAKTDSTGTYTLSVATNKVGTNNVTLAYTGNAKYNAYEINTTFNVGKQNVTVTYEPITNVDYGTNVTITGYFKDSDEKAIKNSNVKIFINGQKYYAKTDNTGKYILSVKTNKVGTNNVTIGYSGNDKYNPYETNTTFTVTGKQPVTVTYEPINDVNFGENVTITGKFMTNNGKAISNSNVKIDINGIKYLAKTDNTGKYTLSTQANTLGTNKVTIGYSGKDKYEAYETNTTFTVTAY
ncbi:right-handed parallel beta-helix repeat-containing protein, partial [Methanosphaera sp.]|uniref:right-handed parallel beta-helix repeat-containing protein n=1 Tax=Methanosphaera sp. TaxID=2666342 RepID=UPI002E798CB3